MKCLLCYVSDDYDIGVESDYYYGICDNCLTRDIYKCECGHIYLNSVRCRSCISMPIEISVIDDQFHTIKCLNDYYYQYLKSSGELFDKIYDDLTNYSLGLVNSYLKKKTILIQTLTGKRVKLVVDNQVNNIYLIKCMFQIKEGIPPIQARLIFGGKQLEDSRLLGDYNIRSEDIIHLVLRMRGD